jgi:hypothetical protein
MQQQFNFMPGQDVIKRAIMLDLPGIPPSLNEVIGTKPGYVWRLKKNWFELLEEYEDLKPPKPYKKAIVWLVYRFPSNVRRDPDNFVTGAKFILDGLVNLGFLEDDSFDNVEIRIRRGKNSKKNPRTIVLIDGLEESGVEAC